MFCSVSRRFSRAADTWLSACRVRLAVWKPLNRFCVTVRAVGMHAHPTLLVDMSDGPEWPLRVVVSRYCSVAL